MSEKPTHGELKQKVTDLERKAIEYRQAHKAQQEIAVKYENLIENIDASIVVIDKNGTYQYVNKKAAQELSGKPKDIIGKSLLDFFPGDIANKHLKSYKQIIEGATRRVYEESSSSPGGDRTYLITEQALKGSKGNRLALQRISIDITERKQVERTLENEFNLRTSLLDNVPGCIAMILKKGTREIVASNRLAREIGAVPGETCFKTCAERDDTCPFCLASKLWMTGQSQRIEVKYRGVWYEGIWALLSDDLYVHYIFDITERRRTEEALRELNNELENKVKQRTSELEEINAALKAVLKHIHKDKIEFEESILSNVKTLILPYLEKLKKGKMNTKYSVIIDNIESSLNDIVSPLIRNLSSKYLKLTPTEIQVANLIRHGKTSKEIADSSQMSKATIDTHRYNIRKKLGIKNKKINLRTHLLSLE